MGEWEPLLVGREEQAAKEAICAIAEDLAARRAEFIRSPLLLSELSLFFRYVAVGLEIPSYDAISEQCYEAAACALAQTPLPLSLFGGVAQVGWINEHLFEPDGTNEAIDDLLLTSLSEPATPDTEYDLIRGLVGLAVYFFEGLPAAASSRGLRLVLMRLQELCEHGADGIAWSTGPRRLPEMKGEGDVGACYDLGVAHGSPGILAVLAMAVASGIETPRAERLAKGLVSWLRSRKQSTHEVGSVFPNWWSADAAPSRARQAWCYGDPGLASAWLWSAQLMGRDDWKEEALELLAGCLPMESGEAGIVDAGLCHGSAGLAQIFNRAYQHTRQDRFRLGALEWLRRTLSLRGKSGIGGYRAYMPLRRGPSGTIRASDSEAWTDNPSFLEGSIGTGLCLLASVSRLTPDWDRRLLISTPPSLRSPP